MWSHHTIKPLDKVVACRIDPTTLWHVPERLKLIKKVGSGSYGSVVSFQDEKQGGRVAIKRIGDAFSDLIDAKRTLREIKILQQVYHENIIHLKEVLPPPEPDFSDIYIMSELVETDLHKVIYSNQELSPQQCQYFLYQLVRGLIYLHSANIVHRDLKPSNLLVNLNCDLKICDFGLARGLDTPKSKGMSGSIKTNSKTLSTCVSASPSFALTDYVVTRWYRAPELLLNSPFYDCAIDMWSVGCIFAEMLSREALFTGRNNEDQLWQIVDVVGTPNERDLSWLPHRPAASTRRMLHSIPRHRTNRLRSHLPEATDPLAIDLLSHLLHFNPLKRLTAKQCIRHPYFKNLYSPEHEVLWASRTPVDWTYHGDLVKERLQDSIYEQMLKFNPMMAIRDAHKLNKRRIRLPPYVQQAIPSLSNVRSHQTPEAVNYRQQRHSTSSTRIEQNDQKAQMCSSQPHSGPTIHPTLMCQSHTATTPFNHQRQKGLSSQREGQRGWEGTAGDSHLFKESGDAGDQQGGCEQRDGTAKVERDRAARVRQVRKSAHAKGHVHVSPPKTSEAPQPVLTRGGVHPSHLIPVCKWGGTIGGERERGSY
eukprot:GHVN01073463.1.p1 GENE.GHVN01073463.1~~GHVN01073463.1.p1  ORF type:complete len:593 (+),score=71.29 GHVN01073463.1:226-2004(+)